CVRGDDYAMDYW
nr:immunoglobulin heavy chain junction region [Mus musculus]MBK4196702.1 immunoglobulin heavy chain junction region [Mus musculus]